MVPTTPAMSRKGGIRSAAMSGKMERSMNPMGRNQQYRPGKTRGKRIFIRVSDQELEEIRSAANERGVSISRYLVEAHEASCNLEAARKACETGPVVEQLKAIRTEIWHIGHNVNQIAHNTNHDMSVSQMTNTPQPRRDGMQTTVRESHWCHQGFNQANQPQTALGIKRARSFFS